MARAPRWTYNDGTDAPPQRFDPFDLVVVGATFAVGVTNAVHGVALGLSGIVRRHANWRADRREFDGAVREGIERLP